MSEYEESSAVNRLLILSFLALYPGIRRFICRSGLFFLAVGIVWMAYVVTIGHNWLQQTFPHHNGVWVRAEPTASQILLNSAILPYLILLLGGFLVAIWVPAAIFAAMARRATDVVEDEIEDFQRRG